MAGPNRSSESQLKSLDAQSLLRGFAGGVAWLGENKNTVDSLNVFPVPDGDTGTNMYLTMSSALKEAEKVKTDSVGEVADAIAMGSLMGARGNSGVIFSQLMRGFAKQLHNMKQATPADFAAALQEASNMAYKAVMKPVEGTVLTVARMSARAGVHAAREGKDVTGVLNDVIHQADSTLAKTPDMLPTLKEAGVVDAGGKGYLLFLEGFAMGISGQEAPVKQEQVVHQPVEAASEKVEQLSEMRAPKKEIMFGYCTEMIIKGEGLDPDTMKRAIAGATEGDSMLVVGGPETVKVHFHTNNPGRVLETCGSFGTLHEIHISNMRDQNEEFSSDEEDDLPESDGVQSSGASTQSASAGTPLRDMGIVAVAAGEGVEEILKSLGVDIVVTGGQTMNPSIQEIVAAIEATSAKEVIVLPNNGNVVLTARQAADIPELSNVKVHVVPSKSVPQGLAALLAMTPQIPVADNVEKMIAAMDKVKTGEVTYAVRDSKFNGFSIKQNDIIGLIDGDLKVAGQSLPDVTMQLFEAMRSDEDEIATILYGADVSSSDAESMLEALRAHFPDMEFELQYGGQPLYYYLVSVE